MIDQLRSALHELTTLVEAHLEGEKVLDSFTTQPARQSARD